jgi:hypothetical protein
MILIDIVFVIFFFVDINQASSQPAGPHGFLVVSEDR